MRLKRFMFIESESALSSLLERFKPNKYRWFVSSWLHGSIITRDPSSIDFKSSKAIFVRVSRIELDSQLWDYVITPLFFVVK